MMKRTIQLLLAMCIAIPAFSQSVELHAPAGPQDAGPVEVAVEINGFTTNIGALTLEIDFDTDLLSFSQIQDFTVGGVLLTNPTDDGLKLSWTTPTPQTGSNLDGLFLTVVFDYQGGFNADLTFNEEESEVSSLDSPIPGVQWLGTTIFSTGDPVGTISLNNGALVPAVPGADVSIPVYISGFETPDDAYAFDLQVEYDTDRLNYLAPTDNTIGFTVGHEVGIIDLNVFNSGAPIVFDADPVIMLNFQYLGTGKADVTFKPGSIVNGAAGQILNVLYESGGVNDDITAIAGQLTIEKVISEGMIIDDLPVTEEVSVSASGLSGENITALTLNIAYDDSPDRLVYKNFIPGPLGGGWTFSHSNGMLTFQKVDLGGFTIADGELFRLVFDYYGEFDPDNPAETMQADIEFAPATLLQNEDFAFLAPGLVDGWVALCGIITADVDETHITCNGADDGIITVSDPQGATGEFEVSIDGVDWFPILAGGTYSFTGLGPDLYTVEIRDANFTFCGNDIAVDLEITEPDVLDATLASTDVDCDGPDNGTITVSNPTGGYGEYEVSINTVDWFVLVTDYTFTGLAADTYTVEIRDKDHPACVVNLGDVTILDLVGIALAAVNDAADAIEMRTALEDPDLCLDLDDYNTLVEGRKNALAQDMLDNRPAGGYASQEDVEELFDLLVDFRMATQAAVNAANDGTVTAADFLPGGLIADVGDALTALPTGTSVSGGVIVPADISDAIDAFNDLPGVYYQDIILDAINDQGFTSFTQLILAAACAYETIVLIDGFESNQLEVHFLGDVTATNATPWDGLAPDAIVAAIVDENDKKDFLDAFFEVKVSIEGVPTVLNAAQLDALLNIDWDSVVIGGDPNSFTLTFLDGVIELSYDLDKGNTGASRIDAEWIGSDKMITFCNDPLADPEEPAFKVEFTVPYDDVTGVDYTADVASMFIDKDKPLIRPFAPGIESGTSTTAPVAITYAVGSYAVGLSAEYTLNGGTPVAYTSGEELTAPGDYVLTVTNDANPDVTPGASTTIRFTIIGLYKVVFTVEDAAGIPITDAEITFDGVPNAPGIYEFDELEADTYDYLVEKTDYHPVSGQVEVTDQDVFISIVLIATADVVGDLEIAFDENVTVIDDQCFDAYYSIVVAGQGFDFIVEPGASATLIAGESITLLPGVSVKPGGFLHAYISQTSFCPPQVPDKGDDAVTGVEEMEELIRTGPFFKVFPNPTTGAFRVELEDVAYDKDVLVEVYDLMGNRLIREMAFSERELVMSLADQPTGMYIIRVTVDGQVGMERLIKR